MWKLFKTKTPEEKVNKIISICSPYFWCIMHNCYLTDNQKIQEIEKTYNIFGEHILLKYGQKYVDFFDEKLYEKGWIFDKKYNE